jgi:hypothetical protein
MSKKRQAYFNNVAMFSLGSTILLMSLWTGNMVRDTLCLKK